MKEELVSIITPSFNSAKYIKETIESIQAQTYKNWELLITDDCSTDQTVDIVQKYASKDSRIHLFSLKTNSGAGAARNNSIAHAKGRYIAFCDSDDLWDQDKLDRQIAFMNEKDTAFSYSSYNSMDERSGARSTVEVPPTLTLRDIIRCNQIGCLTAVYDTAKVGKIYMPLLRKRQDWGLWILVLQKCQKAYGITEALGTYRIRESSISRSKFNLVKYNMAIYEEVLGWSKLHAALYFTFVFTPNYLFKILSIRKKA